MFVNCSNHPSNRWAEDQISAAKWAGGDIVDIPFPPVNPRATHDEVAATAKDIAGRILSLNPNYVMVQGEMTLTYEIVRRLREFRPVDLHVVAATSERDIREELMADGTTRRSSVFKFVQWREY